MLRRRRRPRHPIRGGWARRIVMNSAGANAAVLFAEFQARAARAAEVRGSASALLADLGVSARRRAELLREDKSARVRRSEAIARAALGRIFDYRTVCTREPFDGE
jgi:hypothetical protein